MRRLPTSCPAAGVQATVRCHWPQLQAKQSLPSLPVSCPLAALQAPDSCRWPQLQAKQPLQSLSPEKRPAPLVSLFQGAASGRAHSAYSTERHSGRAGPAAQAEAGVAPKPLTLEEVPEGHPGAGLEPACSSPSRVGMKLQHLKQRQQVGRVSCCS